MPEVTLQIGGRAFVVACQSGEEPHLEQAASLLNTEAETLQKSIGRVPENRMLLMAGLMLADRTVELAEKAATADQQAKELGQQLRNVEAKAAELTTRALHANDGSVSREELEEAKREAAAAIAALERAAERVERLTAG